MSERTQRGHETDGSRSKPSDFPFSLPANNIPEKCKKLAVLVSTDKTKEVLDSQLSHEQVKGLTDNEVEKFYKRYEAYIGSKTTKTLLRSFFMLASKAIGMVVKVDDVEALQKDLQKDFVMNSTFSSVAGNMALHCGRLLAFGNAALITAKHINFQKETEKEPRKEPVQEHCREADKELVKIFTLLDKTWLRNGMHLRYLPMQRRCYQKLLRQNLQTLGELQLEKKLAKRNRLGCEAKKNQKPPDAPAEEKEKSENASGGVNSYLLLGIGGLVVSVLGLYYQREAIMTTLRRTPAHAVKMLRLRQNQSQSPTQPQSSVNGLKFFHIIYLQPCQTTSWSKVLSALQCFTVCGELLRHCPTTNQTIF